MKYDKYSESSSKDAKNIFIQPVNPFQFQKRVAAFTCPDKCILWKYY